MKSEGRRPPSSRTFTPTGPSPYFSGCGDCHPISPGAQTSLVISATCGNRNSARLSRHFPGHITSRCSRVKRKTPSGRDSNPVPRTSHFVERAVYIHYARRSYMPLLLCTEQLQVATPPRPHSTPPREAARPHYLSSPIKLPLPALPGDPQRLDPT